MKVEFIIIGDELLDGTVKDDHTFYLSDVMNSLGIEVIRSTIVGDVKELILDALVKAVKCSDIVVVSGGLGPTSDDITTITVAEMLKRKLILNQEALNHITKIFESKGLPLSEEVKKQAYFPEGALIIKNRLGTAFGYTLEIENSIVFFLPGVPEELHSMVEETVIPYIKRGRVSTYVGKKVLKIFGLTESEIFEKIKGVTCDYPNVKLGFRPTLGENHIKIWVKSLEKELPYKILEIIEKRIREKIGDFIFGSGNDTLESVLGELLKSTNLTISVAESCTGGLISNTLTNVSGSSNYFIGGVVAYSNEVKKSLLKVSEETLNNKGAVSEEVALQMAQGIRNLYNSSIGIGVTGIAGPEGGSVDKPVGTVYIAIADPYKSECKKYNFRGNREKIKILTTKTVLNGVRKWIMEK